MLLTTNEDVVQLSTLYVPLNSEGMAPVIWIDCPTIYGAVVCNANSTVAVYPLPTIPVKVLWGAVSENNLDNNNLLPEFTTKFLCSEQCAIYPSGLVRVIFKSPLKEIFEELNFVVMEVCSLN